MAHHKSAKKRIRSNESKRLRNKYQHKTARTFVRRLLSTKEKAEAEEILKKQLIAQANSLSGDQNIMLKLSLPTKANLYKELVDHPRVVRVVALSGGYSREVANQMLAENNGVIASFSRALAEGLSAQQSDTDFDAMLNGTIQSIYEASIK